ncbi:protein disulfide isomerase Creld1 isoform X1 [Sardina pilchardus]|uniref:protein disulfide isomerase Creld1 isoform X1 n=1 Tax=Sardina pilchardus TaxID=27697 RepID=UPI002E1173E3
MAWSYSLLPALALMPLAYVMTVHTAPCQTCRKLTQSFIKGIERTANKNFGGGNTAWEEEKLAKYTRRCSIGIRSGLCAGQSSSSTPNSVIMSLSPTSLSLGSALGLDRKGTISSKIILKMEYKSDTIKRETRLLEIVETICEKTDFECNKLLEQIEDQVETWWFHRQLEAPDLFEWLCIQELRLCCPPGQFGPDCAQCPSGPHGVCGGLGRCEGDGTRLGDGECVCDPGYSGPLCQDCADGYYREKSSNGTQPPCSACFHTCRKCTGPHDYSCLDCKSGWILHDHKCIDVDECGTELARCPSNTYCFNTDGSYECRGCDQSCVGCMGSGPARCKKCSRGYKLHGAKCLDVDECNERAIACPGLNEACINEEGSFRCECAEGFIRRDSICVENILPTGPEKGLFDDMTDDEVLVLQQMFFGVVICALATLAAKGDMVFTAIFIGGVAAMAGYWISEKGDRMLDGILKGR